MYTSFFSFSGGEKWDLPLWQGGPIASWAWVCGHLMCQHNPYIGVGSKS